MNLNVSTQRIVRVFVYMPTVFFAHFMSSSSFFTPKSQAIIDENSSIVLDVVVRQVHSQLQHCVFACSVSHCKFSRRKSSVPQVFANAKNTYSNTWSCRHSLQCKLCARVKHTIDFSKMYNLFQINYLDFKIHSTPQNNRQMCTSPCIYFAEMYCIYHRFSLGKICTQMQQPDTQNESEKRLCSIMYYRHSLI